MAVTAIVAIPAQDDFVWKISSEKIPHLTILQLGDQKNNPQLQQMINFVEHIAESSLTRFGLSVDRRGTLGEKDADVLFFNKNWDVRDLATARGYMLANPDILAAYMSVPQFDPWQPHLTLGFPETPAKPDKRDFPEFTWVRFDKIAVWTDDFEGPTFDLKKQAWDVGFGMSDLFAGALSHHGVKGMKWGVRKDNKGRRHGSPTAHPDAVKAKLFKAKVKDGSTDSLSTDELRDLVTRMNLEKQFDTLRPPTAGSRTKKLLADTLLGVGKQQAAKALNDQASKQITRLLVNAGK